MLDFRYHALSLVAVLVALVVGLLLGIAIGDQGLVSSAEQSLRDDLRSDIRDAQAESEDLVEVLERRERYEQLTLPKVVGTRLAGRRVHLVFLASRSEPVFDRVREAVEAGGGELGLVGTVDARLDLEAIAAAAEGTQFEDLAEDPALLEEFGRRVGVQLVRGGRLLREVRSPLLAASSGSADEASAIVVHRATEGQPEGEDAERADTFTAGLFAGVTAAGGMIAGVEETTTAPSQVPWYRDRGIASVDNVDEVPGLASLAVVLAGEAEGAYGIKSTRDAYVPDALVRFP